MVAHPRALVASPARIFHTSYGRPRCRCVVAQIFNVSVSPKIVADRPNFHARAFFFLSPRRRSGERSEERGDLRITRSRHLLSPSLSSIGWRRGSVWLRICRATGRRLAGLGLFLLAWFAADQSWAASFDQSHRLFGMVLQRFVKGDLVDYSALKAYPKDLNEYLDQLGAVPEKDFMAFS